MDPKIQAQYEAVREELKESSLTLEHQELLNLRLQDAISCANGAPDKVPLIASVVALGAIGSIRGEIRLEPRITAAVTRGLSGAVEDIRGIITQALNDHILRCPMRSDDFAALNKRLAAVEASEAASEDPEILGIKGKTLAYFGKVLKQTPQLTGICILWGAYKILELLLGALKDGTVADGLARLF